MIELIKKNIKTQPFKTFILIILFPIVALLALLSWLLSWLGDISYDVGEEIVSELSYFMKKGRHNGTNNSHTR